jgi:hypothetical protein
MINDDQKIWFEEHLKIGNIIPVYYNPNSPSEAVLVKGNAGGEYFTLIYAIGFLIGATALFYYTFVKTS